MTAIRAEMLLGHVELESRYIPTSNGMEYQSRAKRYNGAGELTEVTPWETVSSMTWREPEDTRPWWRKFFSSK